MIFNLYEALLETETNFLIDNLVAFADTNRLQVILMIWYHLPAVPYPFLKREQNLTLTMLKAQVKAFYSGVHPTVPG